MCNKQPCPGKNASQRIACEQALLFERVKQASRERAAPRLLVLARLASLAQIGELARRLYNEYLV